MNFDLKSYWFDFAISQKIHDELSIEVTQSQMFDISFGDTKFHFLPNFLYRFVVEFSRVVHIYERPVDVQEIYIFELHQLQKFFNFSLHVLMFTVEYLRGNEEFFSLYSTL